jgi:hypothetical protein
MFVEEDSYKGKPILILRRTEDEKYPFSFGLAKARSILESLDEIHQFVDQHTNPNEM